MQMLIGKKEQIDAFLFDCPNAENYGVTITDTLGILTDVRYALRQLRQFHDAGRAIDALARVEVALTGE